MKNLFNGGFNGKKILITGHTGFKGSWLAFWLQKMEAHVFGVSLEPPTSPNHFSLLNLDSLVTSYIHDINDYNGIKSLVKKIDPDLIFHLAAQPLVRKSYEEPLETLNTNIIGTANILEASKKIDNLKAIIVVTSDKCYENKEWLWGYRENEPMGGKDPYSASKGCAELIVSAYRDSFYNERNKLLASVRAGNVIGGGDWAKDRILTDIVTSTSNNEEVFLRYPNATRPWQFVLEPLSGYLTLASKLLEGNYNFADAWNFGPDVNSNKSVIDLVKQAQESWDKIRFCLDKKPEFHEANYLMLDSSKANKLLNWEPVWEFKETVRHTIIWYKNYYLKNEISTEAILIKYIKDAKELGLEWSNT